MMGFWRRFGCTLLGIAICVAAVSCPSQLLADDEWAPTGKYTFAGWSGPPIPVYYSIPPGSDSDTPILIVIPGAKRNARQYRDEWDHLAIANGFITLVIKAAKSDFPTEHDYNLGGLTNANGEVQPREKWLFSAIDPLFNDFKERFGSRREKYRLYGHSAGGGFVHLFLLLMPDAKIERAVAGNPAFYTMPDPKIDFPFGTRGLALSDDALEQWFARPFTILLGDRDLGPRTQPLSNSEAARRQGPHDFARGLSFYHQSLCAADTQETPLHWNLEIAHDVGHSNAHMASYAVKHLFRD